MRRIQWQLLLKDSQWLLLVPFPPLLFLHVMNPMSTASVLLEEPT